MTDVHRLEKNEYKRRHGYSNQGRKVAYLRVLAVEKEQNEWTLAREKIKLID